MLTILLRRHRLNFNEEFRLCQTGDDDHCRTTFDIGDVFVPDGSEAGHVGGINDIDIEANEILECHIP